MRKSTASIMGISLVALIFLALISTVYLQHLPNKQDLEGLRIDLTGEFGILLNAGSQLDLKLLEPESDGRRMGIAIACSFRREVRKNPRAVGLELDRMAKLVLNHRKWRGKIDLVRVSHVGEPKMERVHRTAERA